MRLDERQRAMLQEMHIRVWWPRPEAPELATASVPVSPAAITQRAMAKQQLGATPEKPASPVQDPVVPSPEIVASMDWPELAQSAATCAACKLCVGRKAAVFETETQPRQVDWLVVGEPPDEHEERAGAPFAGPSGQLLNNMLRAVQLTRNGLGCAGARLTNVVKCRPAAVRNPQADELAACAMYLRREITLARPKVILAMGRFAALSLLSQSTPELANLPLGKLRGRVLLYHGVPVVVTHHPSRLLRAPEDKAQAWADLCLAQSVARASA